MRHLLTTTGLPLETVTALLDTAEALKQALLGREVPKLPTLRGRTVITLFYESSTRTRTSFEIAGKWMSADVVNISASGSAVVKGESLRDTALTLAAMGADCVVIRHPASGAAHRLAGWVSAHVINAGDGTHQHPTQALLDAATLRERLGDLNGRTVTIVGDVLHSRVARSNIELLITLGARIHLVAPPTLLPCGVEHWGVEHWGVEHGDVEHGDVEHGDVEHGDVEHGDVEHCGGVQDWGVQDRGREQRWPVTVGHDLDAALPGSDAVMVLRVQAERMHGGFFPSAREYAIGYGLTEARLGLLPEHAVVLHPGPMLRGMEIAHSVADSPRAAITEQVRNGVHVRMAVLYHLLAAQAEVPA